MLDYKEVERVYDSFGEIEISLDEFTEWCENLHQEAYDEGYEEGYTTGFADNEGE
jgi:hypothetical protein